KAAGERTKAAHPRQGPPARWPHWGRGWRCALVAGSRVGDPRRRGAGAPPWDPHHHHHHASARPRHRRTPPRLESREKEEARGLRPGRRQNMARGQQKIQSQQKNAKKQAGQKKKQGHDQKAAAKAALIYTCTVCRTQMPDPKTFKQHFESKHPKTPLPPELADVQA
uniref:Uncharacterized protein n=1 Tax=Ovis aries TaxID=9940 RepID=A0AC11CDQ2_SHEEP